MHDPFGGRFHLALSTLRFGHDADPPVNARKTGRLDDIGPLAASIEAHGLIHDLVVTGNLAGAYVIDGNRRLAALRHLVETGKRDADAPVACREYTNGDAAEVSLAANIMRLPLHEADQYEAFVELAGHGLGEAEIAGRFGVEEKRVRRFLALGRLHPKIRQAWRDNAFGHDTVGCVRAFTLAPSIEDQERVFDQLSRKPLNHTSSFFIQREFGLEHGAAQRHYAFVGRAAYEAAGGIVVEDLFGDLHRVSDPGLAKRLADEKLLAECASLIAAGWGWALPKTEAGETYTWKKLEPADRATAAEREQLANLQRLSDAAEGDDDAQAEIDDKIEALENAIAARGFSAEAKASAGCVVDFDRHGGLVVTHGLVMPASTATKVAKATGVKPPAADKEPAGISAALAQRLSQQLTRAVQKALPQDPAAGFAALLAGALCGGTYEGPVRIKLDGFEASAAEREKHFGDAFERLRVQDFTTLAGIAARVAALTVDCQTFNAAIKPLERPAHAALVHGIKRDVMHWELKAAFDAQDYFASVPKALILTAIGEAINPDEARKLQGKPSADVRAFALANIPGTPWLPPELRLEDYANPWQAPAPAAKPAEAQKTRSRRRTPAAVAAE